MLGILGCYHFGGVWIKMARCYRHQGRHSFDKSLFFFPSSSSSSSGFSPQSLDHCLELIEEGDFFLFFFKVLVRFPYGEEAEA